MELSLRRVRGRSRLLVLAVVAGALAGPAFAQQTECDATNSDKEVRALHFEGNHTFEAGVLSQFVVATPSSLGRRLIRFGTKRCLDPAGLGQDIVNLRQFYRLRGFYDVRVDTLVAPAGAGAISVTFRVAEGRPIVVDTFSVDGLDSVRNRNDVVRDLNLGLGRRFGRVMLFADQDSLVGRLRNSGYPYADVFPDAKTDSAAHRATVRLAVITGPYTRIGKITVQSTPVLGRTAVQIRPAVIERLLGFRSGDEYSDRSLITARRTLIQVGTFDHVEVAAVRDTTVVKHDSTIDVTVEVREGTMRQVDTEFGWATLDCFRTSAQFTDKNFASRAEQFEFTGRASKLGFGAPTDAPFSRENLCVRRLLDDDVIASSVVNYSLNATLHQAVVPGHANGSVSAYREVRGEYRAYLRTTYIGGETSVTRQLRQNVSARAAYTLEYGRTQAEPAVLCGVFQRCDAQDQAEVTAKMRFAVASFAAEQQKTDNPVDPRNGTIIRGEVRGASPWLLADTSLAFLKGTFDAVYYRALAPRTVFAVRLRGGAIGGGATSNGTKLPPPQERLYAGGASSVRGFRQNELGDLVYVFLTADTTKVNDSTVVFNVKPNQNPERSIPVGGSLLLVGNLDMRFRDPFFPNLIQYTVFTDVGAVWTPTEGSPGLVAHLKYTPGVAARYFSGIGPIQVNVGYNPYPRPAGRALFAPPDQKGGFSSLFCISPGADLPVHVTGNALVQQSGACPATFTPSPSGGGVVKRFLSKLALSISIGPDF